MVPLCIENDLRQNNCQSESFEQLKAYQLQSEHY
jgi:hypothetical protein